MSITGELGLLAWFSVPALHLREIVLGKIELGSGWNGRLNKLPVLSLFLVINISSVFFEEFVAKVKLHGGEKDQSKQANGCPRTRGKHD
jgi:hypothetical protein